MGFNTTGVGAQRDASRERAEAARKAEAARREAAEAARRAQEKQTRDNNNSASIKGDADLRAIAFKSKLQRENPAPSPGTALAEIKALPKPNPSDSAAVKTYKQERAAIADNAIRNGQPPRIEDFRNLNGATASHEQRAALSSYNAQIGELRTISAEAKTYPDRILTPSEAVAEINDLPRPDRENPQAIEDYNKKRANIADAALLYAKPPTRDDFKGLPPRLVEVEYRDALSSYNSDASQLREASQARHSGAPPTLTDAEANQAADDLISARGGASDVSNDEAHGIGRDLADLARTDPEAAVAVMNKVQEKLNGTEKGDNVADGFVASSSVDELREISRLTGGAPMLEDLQNRLTTGDVHENERADSDKIQEAITGLNPNSLTGNPEDDAQTVDAQLKNLPPEMRESYVNELLRHPFGQQAIKYAGAMTPEGAELLGEALGEAYASNPTETAAMLKEITDSPDASLYPYNYQSGLAYAIGKSGNDDLINSFAQNEINRAKGDPDEVRGYLNAATAYAGLSPEALQDVMKNNPDFFNAINEAGRLTGGSALSGGFENGNIWETGLGDLMEKASQIKDANGNATPEAIKLFETVVDHAGSNYRTMEGLGAFFIENAQQLVDKYTNPLDPNTPGSEVLANFFANVVFSPISEVLKYNGGSLVDAVMGDANGNGGVIGGIVDSYLNQANARGGDREQDGYLGQRIGFLWSALSNGFLGSVENYKDKWNDDKATRDFTFDMLGRGLGQIASRFGLPGELVELPLSAAQGIFDARAEDDKEKQLEKFKTAFNELNNAMFSRLNNYDAANENVEGLNNGFTTAYNWEQVQELINDKITGD